MTRYIIFALISVVFASCQLTQKAAVDENLPAWSKERPRNSYYYIGIAKVDKKLYPLDYQETAKKIALNDLASEISVKIESNSLVSSYEDNSGFSSDYQQYIKTETSKDLTGYELEATYETKHTYQVYYKLSKSKWDQIQADRKYEASKKSYLWYQKAKQEEEQANFTTASQYYIDGLLELKKYWNESVSYKKDTLNLQLDKELKSDLVSLLSDAKIVSKQKEVFLNSKNKFSTQVEVYVENSKGEKIKNIPLKASYRKSNMTYNTSFLSTDEPYVINVEGVDYKRSYLNVKVEADKNKMFKIRSSDKRMLSFVYDAFDPKPISVPIRLELPKVYISVSSEEKYQSPHMHYLKDAIKEALAKQKVGVANSIKESQYHIIITAHESKGSDAQRFKTMYLSYTLEVQNTHNQQVVHSQSSPQVKGADASFEKAKEKAYVKASEAFKYEHAKTLIKGILK